MARELVWTGFMSLDGVVDSPGGVAEGHRGGGWVFSMEFVSEAFALKGEELTETTALMFGRRSYEAFAPIWPGSEDHAAYQDLPKYVVSTTLSEEAIIDDWGADRDPAISR
ncbi:dihydrofolate reductase [Arthrobacter pigmenti]|uniref:Dihydrofolate reductase n=1 Tax=Arthrobacter pigmenti TaxID=271432 RepID=A0A846RRK4_9MICC|nr:dihydrofolate reductase [Arthrobacter pigmenti]